MTKFTITKSYEIDEKKIAREFIEHITDYDILDDFVAEMVSDEFDWNWIEENEKEFNELKQIIIGLLKCGID